MLKMAQTNILVCDCGGSNKMDGEKLAKACGSQSVFSPATALCRGQSERIATAMQQAKDENQTLLIACTQETSVFESIAEEADFEIPATVNIREFAGWSDESASATPKIAALLRHASDRYAAARSLTLNSTGRCLIYADASRPNGGADAALELGKRLKNQLGVTVLIANAANTLMPNGDCSMVATGKIKSARGHFTKFELVIDHFAEALPHSRDTILFEDTSNNVETNCDIIIDLTGESPLFTGWEKRDGYLRAAGEDISAMGKLETQAMQMIGEFEKPIYVNFDESLCAHSRNKIAGCSRCLDVCPAGAIQSAGDHVSIDPGICGGCGLCGAVCPSGAAQTAYPPIENQYASMQKLLEYYTEAGGKSPRLLIHDNGYGLEMIETLARFGRGLPATILPISVHAVGRSGHDMMVAAIALGYKQVVLLLNPAKSIENEPLANEVLLARAMLAGVNADDDNRIVLIDESDPDMVAEKLYKSPITSTSEPAPFSPVGAPRSMTRLAMRGLAKANKAENTVITLPEKAPYGRVEINAENCTVCLSCVGACPAGALQDNPDSPQLLFREDACLQCGICTATCPEKVISMVAQFNLSNNAMVAELVVEDTPFHCTSCGKAFGSTKSIERVISRLTSHSMFQNKSRIDMLKMCEDCRVGAMFSQGDKMLDIGERPKPRTTDDYLN
jgi:ferredoxin